MTKSYFMLRNAPLALHLIRPSGTFPSRGRLTVGLCFSDRDFATSPPITSFSFSEKEKEGKRKTAQGVPPRSEPRVAPVNRDDAKIRGSMRLRPPETPRGTGKPGETNNRDVVQSGESFCIRAKAVRSAFRAARFRLCLPLEGKVPEGRMRCSAIARYEA